MKKIAVMLLGMILLLSFNRAEVYGLEKGEIADIKKSEINLRMLGEERTRANPIDYEYNKRLEKVPMPHDYTNIKYSKLSDEFCQIWENEMNNAIEIYKDDLWDKYHADFDRANQGWADFILNEEKFLSDISKNRELDPYVKLNIENEFNDIKMKKTRMRTMEIIDYLGRWESYEFSYQSVEGGDYRSEPQRLEEGIFNYDIHGEFKSIEKDNKISKVYKKEIEESLKAGDWSHKRALELAGRYDEVWDKELNRVYKVLMDMLDEQGKAKLLESQIAWVQYHMNQDTDYKESEYTIMINKHMDRIMVRTLELHEYVHILGGEISFSDFRNNSRRIISGKFVLPESYKHIKPEGRLTAYGADCDRSINRHNCPEFDLQYRFNPDEDIYEFKGAVDKGRYELEYESFLKNEAYRQKKDIIVDVREKDSEDIILELKEQERIFGEISLPEGEVAPEGGLKVFVEIYRKGGNYNLSDVPELFIEEGKRSVEYEDYRHTGEYSVEVRMESQNNHWTRRDAWAQNITVIEDKNTRCDIVVEKNDSHITGKIYLPEGEVASDEGIDLWVDIHYSQSEDGNWDQPFHKKRKEKVHIASGENHAAYKFSVPSGNYKLEYGQIYNPKGENLYKGGVYTVSVKDKGGNYVDLHLQMNMFISGEIKLEEGQAAEDGLWFVVGYGADYRSIFDKYVYVKMEEGESSLKYKIPVENRGKYLIGYKIFEGSYEPNNGQDHVFSGKSTTGVTEIEDESVDGVNIRVPEVFQIKGNISVDKKAGEGGKPVFIYVSRDRAYKLYDSRGAHIPEGEDNVDFKLSVVGKKNITISADVPNNYKSKEFYRETYYVPHKAQGSGENSKEFSSNSGEMVNIKIEREGYISGKIVLPNGEKSPKGGLEIQLELIELGGRARYRIFQDPRNFIIPEGENSCTFYLSGRDINGPFCKVGDEFIIDYVVKNSAEYTNGYYRKGLCTSEIWNAEKITYMGDNIKNVDLYLRKYD